MKMINNWLTDNGFGKEEEEVFYETLLEDVYMNPRWYLNNLDYLKTFRLSWSRYYNNRPITPRKYVKKE